MRIKRLYTDPMTIEPIEFQLGVNLILGEGDDTSSKTNGVGKSLCIEFLNFALLKQRSHSRVSKIPKESFNPATFICVDFELRGEHFTVKRSLEEAERPRISTSGIETIYAKLEDATDFLAGKMFRNYDDTSIGFREILGPLIRDERSEFKSLVGFFDTKLKAPDNYAPHLMLLGIDPNVYRSIKAIFKDLDVIAADESRIKESVKLVRQKDLKEARSDLNALDEEVEKIQLGIRVLESAPAFDIVKGELLAIEEKMAHLRLRKEVLTKRSSSLAPIAVEPTVNQDEIRDFYNQLRLGLGTNIERELDEVISFKSKIEQFQRHLFEEKSKVIDVEIKALSKQIGELDKQYAKLLSVLDQEGQLKNLRQTFAAYQAKSDELGQLKSFISRYDQLAFERQTKKSELEAEKLRLQGSILAAKERLHSFERKILDIHQFIQGSRKASFEVQTTSKRHIVDIVLRIDDDGSHSVEREKVFIYDLALILDSFTKFRHPGLLVHDNIFDVDDDTLQKSLEYLLTLAPFEDDQQYILTLNIDRVEHFSDEAWYPDLEHSVVASFTKSKRFLNLHYQET
jgi:uncharacterized protein YydD (DUF2326 family)